MNRLGIAVLYDENGIIDRYIEVLLSSLKSEIQEYVIVINGYMDDESIHRLKQYTTKIYSRKNIGFDAGAYKDAFLQFIPQSTWKSYDEIVLMNDTFFGPVTPMKETWELFDSDNVDFWGITRHPAQRLSDGNVVSSHIQSYFIVIKNRLITSQFFTEFWEKLSYPRTYQEAVKNFEIEFTVFFEANGFSGKSLMDLREGLASFNQNSENPCFHSYELLKEFRIPFLKKKFLNLESPIYANMIDALEYIEAKTDYNTDLIWESLFRMSGEKRNWSAFSYGKLDKFYASHVRIYIYGAGKYAKNMQRYFQYRGWTFECFLVSDNAEEFHNCKNFKDVDIARTDGLILALGRTAFSEVYPVIKKEINEEQLMLPDYL